MKMSLARHVPDNQPARMALDRYIDRMARLLDLPTNLANTTGFSIGLSVARRVVELHGGTLAVRSDGPGRGTEAIVILPRLDECPR